MSVYDGGDDTGGSPERPARGGKDITDPAGGAAEKRGGESPADWAGPLPEVSPGTVQGGWCGHPECGGDLVGWLPVSRPARIRHALLLAGQLDAAWMNKVPEDDRRYAGWMPFNNDAFLTLALAALREAPGDPPSFFEIGCGIGTKMLLAHDILGFRVSGIERVPELAIQAAQLGVDVEIGDAAEYGGYGKHDIVWFNRACRDPVLQARLEIVVWENMRERAVAMCANLEAPPPGWIVVDQDMDQVCRGVWQKRG